MVDFLTHRCRLTLHNFMLPLLKNNLWHSGASTITLETLLRDHCDLHNSHCTKSQRQEVL